MKWLDIRFKRNEYDDDIPELYNLETAVYIGPYYNLRGPGDHVWAIVYNTEQKPESKTFSKDDYVFYAEHFWSDINLLEYLTDLQKLISAYLRSTEQMLIIQMDKPEEFKLQLKHLQEKELLPS
jgi:hypothetical protein